jgi:predicted dehydrogenase
LRWGVLGTGGIAEAFAADFRLFPDAGELVAVGSRRRERAEQLAETVSIMGTLDDVRASGGLKYPGD